MNKQVGTQFYSDRLGLVTIYSVESNHTVVVIDSKGKYYRVSGLA